MKKIYKSANTVKRFIYKNFDLWLILAILIRSLFMISIGALWVLIGSLGGLPFLLLDTSHYSFDLHIALMIYCCIWISSWVVISIIIHDNFS